MTTTIGSTTERVEREFFGLHANQGFDWPYGARAEVLDKVAATGVGTMRVTFAWQALEVAPDVYDFSGHDDLVAQAAARGMRILPVLFAPPRWRSSRPPTGARRGTYPPASNAEFAAFAQLMIARYGRGGSLWHERPELPYTPITAWQVWNEPNIPVYWPTGPSPDEYTEMLRTVSAAIKEVDPGARVLTAALPDSRLGIPHDTFLDEMYAAGARGSFDVAAINPYSRSAEGAYRIMNRAREVIDSHGDDAHLWVTEIGWASDGPESRLNVGEDMQAHLIGTVLPTLVQQSRTLKLDGVIYFAWQDAAVYPGGHDFWGLHTGLLWMDGSPKAAYWTFVRAVEGLTVD